MWGHGRPSRKSPRVQALVKVLGVIPARLASTRLPRKVLREIGGIPLVVHGYRAARRSPRLDDLLCATDAHQAAAAGRAHGIPVLRTAGDHAPRTNLHREAT